MDQLELDLRYSPKVGSSNSIFNLLSFTSVKTHDRLVDAEVSAYRYFYVSDHNIKVNINIILNETFVPSGYAYFDTVYYRPIISKILSELNSASTIDVYCYVNPSKNVLIQDVHKNLKIIINSYLIDSDLLRKLPDSNTQQHSWLTYDPSVSMYSISCDFVFQTDVNYSLTPQCYYRTSPSGTVTSLNYPYANKSAVNTCSNPIVVNGSQKIDNVCQCPFHNPKQILACPYYKEDKFKLSTLELYSRLVPREESKSLSDYAHAKTIESYLIRGIENSSYSLSFVEKDHLNNKEVLIKHLVYNDICFDLLEDRNKLIEEARSQLVIILSDYVLDYAHKITNHVENLLDFKNESETKTKKSYLTTLSN